MRRHSAPDSELVAIRRIMAILLAMPSPQRLRVLHYVKDRVELLPAVEPSRQSVTLIEGDLLIPAPPLAAKNSAE
jgi:hypothetical protein